MPLINHSSFSGNKFLRGKHVETIVPALFRTISVPYQRERLVLSDGDFLDLDWIKDGHTKVLLLFHGLEGSSDSQYIKGMGLHFAANGWDICAVNFRTCSGEMNKALRTYHSGATDDVNEVVQHIVALHTYDIMAAGGFSLGGNVLLKYLGEQVFIIPSILKIAFAFSVPCDLAASSSEMARIENTLYMQRFLKSLRYKMKYKANQFKGQLNTDGIYTMRTFTQFDNLFTAPINGFKDAADYYAKCNSLQFLPFIRIPTLMVNALNDPFLTPSCFPEELAASHPYLHLETPEYGGHVGFAERLPNETYWSEQRALEFISGFCT
ncbi:MAG: alpha/beta fold hydrolase [Bacteroidota bacterium]